MPPEIVTIIAMGIAIIGVQITTSLILARRLDTMTFDLSEVNENLARLEGILIGRLEVGNGALTQTGDD